MTTITEALASPNVQAFLRAIRLGEGTSDANGYRRIVGGELFDSFTDHPRKRVWIKAYNVWSTAAGAYQMLAQTWDEMRVRYALPDFSPASQDLAAVGLIARRGALDDVLAGRIEAAIAKCAAEWASLPGSPYGQRTERLDAVLAEYRKYGGAFEHVAPITESQPTWEAPMTPFVAAALPQLVQMIPELIRSFGKGEVTERNAKAAEAVLQVAQAATGAPNAQAAIETIQRDPQALRNVRDALERDLWFETTEAGGDGIEGAREFNQRVSDGNPLMMPALWISAALLVPVYAVVAAVIFGDGWSAEVRIQVITAVLATMGIVGAFWLGSSFGSANSRRAP